MANIVEKAAKMGNLSLLLRAIEDTKLQETLVSPGSFTLFAPTDEAFESSGEPLDTLRGNLGKFKRIVAYHVGFGDIRVEDLAEIDEVMTLEGSVIAVTNNGGKIQLNDANVIAPDASVDGGVIHLIDRVLFPALLLNE